MKLSLSDSHEKILDKSVFIISIDTELIWGTLHEPDHIASYLMQKDVSKIRKVSNDLITLFEKHCIPATWAIVGHLFLENCNGHKSLPVPNKEWYALDPCSNIHEEPLYYGKDLIENIISNRIKHEIGYHTFSHVDFSKCNIEVAKAEIQEGVKLARDLGITLESFVFPKNRIGHIDILKENGFKIYRGKNLQRWSQNKGFLVQKINGAIDKIITKPTEPIWRDGIWEIPTSMQFADPQIPFSLSWRAEFGLNNAIAKSKVFHIYLHPYDLLIQPSLLMYLNNFLRVVAKKRDEDKIQVMTMCELASFLNTKIERQYD